MEFSWDMDYRFLFGIDHYETDLTFTAYYEKCIIIYFAVFAFNIHIKIKKHA